MQLKEKNGIKFFQSEIIKTNHCFTTRIGGVSSKKEYRALNLGVRSADESENIKENYRRLKECMGFTQIITPKQEHTDNIIVIDENTDLTKTYVADAFVTAQKNIAIGVFSADCTPVLMYDEEKKVIAAVHSGWRGTANKIAAKAAKIMKEQFFCNDICVAIGPAIGGCCFEIGEDVKEILEHTHPDCTNLMQSFGEKFKADTKAIIKADLQKEGITKFDISSLCTVCENKLFFSHRKGDLGRQCAFISL